MPSVVSSFPVPGGCATLGDRPVACARVVHGNCQFFSICGTTATLCDNTGTIIASTTLQSADGYEIATCGTDQGAFRAIVASPTVAVTLVGSSLSATTRVFDDDFGLATGTFKSAVAVVDVPPLTAFALFTQGNPDWHWNFAGVGGTVSYLNGEPLSASFNDVVSPWLAHSQVGGVDVITVAYATGNVSAYGTDGSVEQTNIYDMSQFIFSDAGLTSDESASRSALATFYARTTSDARFSAVLLDRATLTTKIPATVVDVGVVDGGTATVGAGSLADGGFLLGFDDMTDATRLRIGYLAVMGGSHRRPQKSRSHGRLTTVSAAVCPVSNGPPLPDGCSSCPQGTSIAVCSVVVPCNRSVTGNTCCYTTGQQALCCDTPPPGFTANLTCSGN